MIEKEILEKVKLVAKFMGIYVRKSWFFGPLYGLYHPSGRPCMRQNRFGTEKAAWEEFLKTYPYSSWDWLIPVIEKIESHLFVTSIDYGQKYHTVDITEHPQLPNTIGTFVPIQVKGTSKIVTVRRAVVKFVEWYDRCKKRLCPNCGSENLHWNNKFPGDTGDGYCNDCGLRLK